MKKFMINNIKLFVGILIGAVIFGGLGVYATIKIQASEIGYKDTTVENTLNYLYNKIYIDDAKFGDVIQLNDGTSWVVLNSSSDDSIRLMSTNFIKNNVTGELSGENLYTQVLDEAKIVWDVNNSNNYSNSSIKNYLENTVKPSIASSLNLSNNDIVNIELINVNDLTSFGCYWQTDRYYCTSSSYKEYLKNAWTVITRSSLVDGIASDYRTSSAYPNYSGYAVHPVITILKSSLY